MILIKLCKAYPMIIYFYKCQLLQDLRVKFIKRYYYTRPSMNNCLQLLSNENKAHIRNLSVFIKKGLNIKQNAITQNPGYH